MMRASLLVILSTSLGLCLPVQGLAQSELDGVVVITTLLEGSRSGFGTGTLVSPDGNILTAYHVVQGARQITIDTRAKSTYTDVTVTKIDTSHDLALLHINHVEHALPYVRIVDQTNIAPGQAVALGHSANLFYQTIPVAITGTMLPSEQLRDPTTHQHVFALTGVPFIPLIATIFNGLSGGPLIINGHLVGVISGSFLQGGSIAWALPVSMPTLSAISFVNKTPKSLAWPDLDLMNPNIKTLRAEISIGARLANDLDKDADLLKDMGLLVKQAEDACGAHRASINHLISKIDLQLQKDPDLSVDSFLGEETVSSTWGDVQSTGNVCMAAIKAHTALSTQLSEIGAETNDAALAFAKSMPDTPTNRLVDDEMAADGERNLKAAQQEIADAAGLGEGVQEAAAIWTQSLNRFRAYWQLINQKNNMIAPVSGQGMFRRSYSLSGRLYSELEKFFRLQT